MQICWKELVRRTYAKCVKDCDVSYSPSEYRECSYTNGQCTDGSTGCLFGQILSEMGVDASPLQGLLRGILETRFKDSEVPQVVISYLSHIQICQDNEMDWGDALIESEILFGEEVDELMTDMNKSA